MNKQFEFKPVYFLIIFISAAALIKLDCLLDFAGTLISLLMPIVFGFILAAVLDAPVNKAEALAGKILRRASGRLRRNIAVGVVYAAILVILAVIVAIMLPQLYGSIRLFINSFDGYYENFMRYAEKLGEINGFSMAKLISDEMDNIMEFIRESLPKIAEKAYNFTSSAAVFLTNTVFAAVISIYLLADKERCLSAAGMVLSSMLGEEKMCRTVRYAGLVTGCFSRFIYGQLTEALILGVMCFLGMIVFGFDYPLLISVIVGVTALIPVVGALIGTIPSALMLFLIEPSQALWFVIFILVLQQIEGNFIYPKVVGKSVGMPPLVVLIAILIGAGVGGVSGILLGVPIASVIYLVIKEKTGNGMSE